ncbi:MAG: metalloenzyme [Planctomycetota bacterium]
MGLFDIFKKKPAPAPTRPRPLPRPAQQRPDPKGKNNYVVITLDSCRYDSFMEAKPELIAKPYGGLEKIEKRYSYASWTAPSHYNLLMGLLPHTSPPNVYASEYYKEDFVRYNQRLGAKSIEFASLVPSLWLPTFLKTKMGYQTHAMVSLPVLNSLTPVNRDFDSFELMDHHNDMQKMLDKMEAGKIFSDERPSFVMMNVGETHYPYSLPGDDPNDLPRISGVHGVFKKLDQHVDEEGQLKKEAAPEFFRQDQMEYLYGQQVRAVKYLNDKVFPRLFDLVPENTWLVVTADHGELFGEAGYFGHGPIMHDKVHEVPYIEGKIR